MRIELEDLCHLACSSAIGSGHPPLRIEITDQNSTLQVGTNILIVPSLLCTWRLNTLLSKGLRMVEALENA